MNETELKKLEDRLWSAADKMRGAVSVSDYKFIVLGLIFLKYISDSFEERYKELVEEGYLEFKGYRNNAKKQPIYIFHEKSIKELKKAPFKI